MKKFLTLFLIMAFAVLGCCCFVACDNKNDDGVIKVNEVTHSIFYAPFYAAINLGYFEEYGIKIELTNGGGSDKSMTALISGDADIALLGPETSVYVKSQGSSNTAKIIGQLTQKDGSFLVGRTQMTDFEWSDLAGSEVIGGRVGGVPAMTLEYLFEQNGLYDGRNITINYGIDFDLITAAFEGGTGDFCTMFEPAASNMQKAGSGYIVASVGQQAGDMPFTAFMATQSYIAEHREQVDKFVRAIIKAMDFVNTSSAEDIAKVLAPSFDGTDLATLANSIQAYKDIGAYSTTPVMAKEDFELLQDVIIDAGVMTKRADFDKLVNNSIAEALLAQ